MAKSGQKANCIFQVQLCEEFYSVIIVVWCTIFNGFSSAIFWPMWCGEKRWLHPMLKIASQGGTTLEAGSRKPRNKLPQRSLFSPAAASSFPASCRQSLYTTRRMTIHSVRRIVCITGKKSCITAPHTEIYWRKRIKEMKGFTVYSSSSVLYLSLLLLCSKVPLACENTPIKLWHK